MKPVIVINAKATDELGWDYPQAMIAFFHLGASTLTQFSADEREEDPQYRESAKIESVHYKANFWPDVRTKQLGKRSRPIYLLEDGELLYDDEDEPVKVFEVDLSQPKYKSILHDPNLDTFGKTRAIIEKHYREEVAA